MSPSRTQPATSRWTFFALATLVWCALRWAQLEWLGWGVGNDVHLYQFYAERWGAGGAPYVDFHPEYPPGALPVFLLPFLVSGGGAYVKAFALEMALFDLASFWLALAWARRLFPQKLGASMLAAVGYLACTAALFPVLYSRFDLVPGALLCAALYAAYAPGGAFVGALLLGIAGGVKLWPFALTPLFLGLSLRQGGLRKLLSSALGIALGTLVTAFLMLPRAGTSVLEFLRFHAARGIQIESTWSTLALTLNALGVADAKPIHEYGAFHVAGKVASWLADLSVPALLALALLPQVLSWRGQLGRAADARGAVGVCVAAGTVLGFMVGGKVLSPQYMLWLVPFLPLIALSGVGRMERGLLALLILLTSLLTTLVYPYWSAALEQREPGHGAALLAVGARNLLLLALYGFTLYSSARTRISS